MCLTANAGIHAMNFFLSQLKPSFKKSEIHSLSFAPKALHAYEESLINQGLV